jgi:hypothetical protein
MSKAFWNFEGIKKLAIDPQDLCVSPVGTGDKVCVSYRTFYNQGGGVEAAVRLTGHMKKEKAEALVGEYSAKWLSYIAQKLSV